MVSDHNNFYYLSGFNSKEYPFEKIGYFDGKVNLPFVTAGARSPLGAFIADHQRILTDSLFAGAMSMRWTLDKGKFVASGTKKINDRKVYVVEYFPNVGSQEFTVKLYFDAENFHHLRTEYNHTIANKENKFGTFGVQSGITITMSEDFDEFKTADDLTLPYSYKIKYLTDSDQGVHSYEWKVNISQYLLDRNLDAKFFTFDSK